MSVPSIIYKKFATYIPLDKMTGIQWFALEPEYGGTTYGTISKKYRFKKEPRLLDIGNGEIRTMIKETIAPHDARIINYSDPDEQYSGGEANKKYHQLVQKYFANEYNGTIIDENHLTGNKEYSVGDLAGPSEIVLWANYPELLEEITPLNISNLHRDKIGGKRYLLSKKKKSKKPKTRKSKKKTRRSKMIPTSIPLFLYL